MTLSSQLEALRKQKAKLPPKHGSDQNLNKPETGEFSFLRRKLAQFRSGKWRRSDVTQNLIRSQSWNQGLQSTRNLQSEWSSSLTSLQENEASETLSIQETVEEEKDKEELKKEDVKREEGRKPVRSQSVLVKGEPPPEAVKFRRHSQAASSVRLRARPVSFAGTETRPNSQFYTDLEDYDDGNTGLSSAQSVNVLDEPRNNGQGHHDFNRQFRKSISNIPASPTTASGKIYRRLSAQNEGRSRSLTHMDTLAPGAVFKDIDKNAASEPARLIVPPLQARRQKLTRSQVNSSEYFSVSFQVGSSGDGDEFVVASKGTSLAEALSSICHQRGIDLTNVNVFLDSYKTPIPDLTTETSWLGGKHILVKGKEDHSSQKSQQKASTSQGVHSRKSSGSYRGRSGRFFSASTEEPSIAESPDNTSKSSKASKQRWSGLFGNSKDTKMESLVEQLNNYSKHGIPQLSSAEEDREDTLYNLEEDWRDIVCNSANLSERVQQQQTAIWELVQTEVAYIHTLKVVTDLFLSCLTNLQNVGILTDVDKTRLFSNITEIYSSNRFFWTRHILPTLTASRESGLILNPQLLLDGFLKFDEIFRPYTKYCAEQSQCQHYCREKHHESELFTAYLVWCETQKDCNRLRLMDILVKPMQRITKYSLLLKAIQKHTESDDHRLSLDLMIRRVDLFVNSVNTTLRQKQDLEKLRGVIARIEAYDVVESKDEDLERLVRSYNDLDLTCPMPGCCNSQQRHLLLEGDLKLKDNATSKMDVHCFLFTDMLLICKPATRRSEGRVRVLRQPYLVERLVAQELNREPATLALVYLTEYRVPCGAFLLSSSDTKLLKSWAANIRKAQELYIAAKQATTAKAHSILALSRQPSSYYEDDWVEETMDNDLDTHSVTSLGLFPLKSPRGSTRGSSLNHSHSGSMEMNEGSSISSISQSRGVSVENEIRGSSQSSDEGVPPLGTDRSHHSMSPRNDRRKCTSPNTLSIQVPVFSCLGQSLPDLNQVSCTSTNPPSSLLLVPPRGTPHRGTSYPPPSPPLRRAPALTLSRNPPLLKTRHIVSSASSSIATTSSCDADIPVIAGVTEGEITESNQQPSQAQQRQALIKRLIRTDNKRYHTAGAIDDMKKQDSRDSSIHKRLSWNCGAAGPSSINESMINTHRPIGIALSTDSVRSSSGVSSTGESVSSGLNVDNEGPGLLGLVEAFNEGLICNTPPVSPCSISGDTQLGAQGLVSLSGSTNQLAELILNDPSLETSDV